MLRKQGLIGSEHAAAMQRFFTARFNPYLNTHRPCGFAVLAKGAFGRFKRRYLVAEDYRTPFEKLTSLDQRHQYLKAGLSETQLRRQPAQCSGTETAWQIEKTKLDLLKRSRISF